MGTLRNSARMPPAKMGSTRSTTCAAKAKTSESRSSATKSVTPTTVTSRACFVFDLIQMFLSRSFRLKSARHHAMAMPPAMPSAARKVCSPKCSAAGRSLETTAFMQ